MPSRRTAYFRHAQHCLNKLRDANRLYISSKSGSHRALDQFQKEITNIQNAQTWFADEFKNIPEAADLCEAFPDAAGDLLDVRQHQRDHIGWLNSALAVARWQQNPRRESVALSNLGAALADQGNSARVIEYYDRCRLRMIGRLFVNRPEAP